MKTESCWLQPRSAAVGKLFVPGRFGLGDSTTVLAHVIGQPNFLALRPGFLQGGRGFKIRMIRHPLQRGFFGGATARQWHSSGGEAEREVVRHAEISGELFEIAQFGHEFNDSDSRNS